jgi:nucleotide-binding universal stress UspA family protein
VGRSGAPPRKRSLERRSTDSGKEDDVRSDGLIVVGVDGSDSARHAAEWAAELASAWGAALHLVHAVPDGTGEPTSGPAWLRELHDAVERAGVDEVESCIVPGRVVDELVPRCRGARLVVLGSYGDGARSGMLAGSASFALVEAADCPVAVVRGAAPRLPAPRHGPVVVGTDALTDDTALYQGAALAVGFGARLVVLHAWSDVVEDAHGMHRTTTSGTELAGRAVARLDQCLRPLREAYPNLAIERHVVDDTALRALLEQAAEARAVVVGHRRGPGPGRHLGSTSRGLVAFAPCPVVVTDLGRT